MALQYQQNDDHDEQSDEQPGLIIDISPALRSRLKRAAAKHDLSVDQYVEDILEKAVAQEEKTEEESTVKQEYRSVSQQTLERLRCIREQIMQERQGQQEPRPISKEGLEGLIQLREQIKQNHPGVVFEDSTEIIRQMREERSQYLSEL
jgi:plasmid stability protein